MKDPEGMEEGLAILSGLSGNRVLDSIPVATSMKRNPERNIELVKDYHAPNVSDKVMKLILSYTDYVKLRVWGYLKYPNQIVFESTRKVLEHD